MGTGKRVALKQFAEATVIVAGVLALLYGMGLVQTSALWLLGGVTAAAAILHTEAAQRRLSGGDLTRRLALRVSLHVALVTACLYLAAVGPLLAIGLIVLLTNYIRQAGSRAWRPVVASTIAAVGLGQVAVEMTWVPSILPVRQSHYVAVLICMGLISVMRIVGEYAARHEDIQETLQYNEQRFRALVQDASEVVMIADEQRSISYLSPAATRVLGYPVEDLLDHGLDRLVHPDDRAALDAVHQRVLDDRGGGQHRLEIRIRHADGGWRWHELTTRNMLDNPAVGGILCNQHDITERRVAADRVAYAARHDSLTGLLNAASMRAEIEHAVGDPDDRPVAVLFLDLDGFKQVNDSLGHAAGDQVLVRVAQLLQHGLRADDRVSRFGGDEFVVLGRVDGPEEAMALAQRLRQTVAEAGREDGILRGIGCSIGLVVTDPSRVVDAATLLQHADTAMYAAKRSGRNGCRLYSAEPPPVAALTAPALTGEAHSHV